MVATRDKNSPNWRSAATPTSSAASGRKNSTCLYMFCARRRGRDERAKTERLIRMHYNSDHISLPHKLSLSPIPRSANSSLERRLGRRLVKASALPKKKSKKVKSS